MSSRNTTSPEPKDDGRRKTRSSNATTRPGKVVQEVLGVRRAPEVIQKQKEEKLERQKAKDRAKALMRAGEEQLAKLEEQEVSAAANTVHRHPRKYTHNKSKETSPVEGNTNAGGRTPVKDSTSKATSQQNNGDKKGKRPSAHESPSKHATPPAVTQQGDDEVLTDVESPPAKRVKHGKGPQPLRRSESTLEFMDVDQPADQQLTPGDDNLLNFGSELSDPPMDLSDDDPTPRFTRNNKKLEDQGSTGEYEPEGDESDLEKQFTSPIPQVKIKRNTNVLVIEDSDEGDVSETEVYRAKRDQVQRKEKLEGKPRQDGGNKGNKGKDRDQSDKANSHKATSTKTQASNSLRERSLTVEKNTKPVHSTQAPQAASGSKVKFVVARRTTSLNGAVTIKTETKAAPPPKKKLTKVKVEVIEGSEAEDERAIGGMRSDEDDSKECELAQSTSAKRTSNHRSKNLVSVKTEPDGKDKSRSKRATTNTGDLPVGANEAKLFDNLIHPVFMKLWLSQDKPWMHSQQEIKAMVDEVCNHCYGETLLPATLVMTKDIAARILVQKLHAYRNGFGAKALEAVLAYFREVTKAGPALDTYVDEIAKWAGCLLQNDGFLFKSTENGDNKRSGGMQHRLVIHTLTAHFNRNVVNAMDTPPGLEGKIKLPYGAIALAATAVYRALTLFSQKLIKQDTGPKLTIVPTLNPAQDTLSTVLSAFSNDNYGEQTAKYLRAATGLKTGRPEEILSLARILNGGGKVLEAPESDDFKICLSD